uniref:Uncharacterized protein n=1 Tax=Ammonifex degensii TaxID=42838 RepID=A0A7C2E9I4_9THEO
MPDRGAPAALADRRKRRPLSGRIVPRPAPGARVRPAAYARSAALFLGPPVAPLPPFQGALFLRPESGRKAAEGGEAGMTEKANVRPVLLGCVYADLERRKIRVVNPARMSEKELRRLETETLFEVWALLDAEGRVVDLKTL